MIKAVLTNYFDATTYSKEFVVNFLVNSNNFIRFRGSDKATDEMLTNMTDIEYVSYMIDNGDIYEFFFSYYHKLSNESENLSDFRIISETEQVECPNDLAELVMKVIATGENLYVRDLKMFHLETESFNFVKDKYWRDGITPGKNRYLGPVVSLSKNHLAAKLSFCGYDYWISANRFFTDLLVTKGLLDRKSISNQLSVGGWILEQIPNDAL